jgi:hypothetical protein
MIDRRVVTLAQGDRGRHGASFTRHRLCHLIDTTQISCQCDRQRIMLQIVACVHIHNLYSIKESGALYLQKMNKYTTQYNDRELLERATDETGNLNEVARRTGISRRRLGKIKAGSPMHTMERQILLHLIHRTLP